MKPNYEKPQESMKPLKIKKKEDYFDKNDDHICIYDIECPIFFGHTIGSALKRTILTSTEGTSIVAIKIKGAQHAFDAIAGVKETVPIIINNIKKISIRILGDLDFTYLKFAKTGSGVLTSSDMEENPNCEIISRGKEICTLDRSFEKDKKESFYIECIVAKGTYYKEEEQLKFQPSLQPNGFIGFDVQFTKTLCDYVVGTETSKVPAIDILTIKITTKGDRTPDDCLEAAAKTVVFLFTSFYEVPKPAEIIDHTEISLKARSLDTLDSLSNRAYNSLISNGITTVGALLDQTVEQLQTLDRVGQQCIQDIIKCLDKHNLSLKKGVK